MKKTSTEIKKDPYVEYVVREFERYSNHWMDKFLDAETDYDNWCNEPPAGEDWENKVHVPVTVEAEQTITPRLLTALFPTEAPVDVQVEGEGTEVQASVIKSHIQHHFRISDVYGSAYPQMSQTVLFGTGYSEAGSWLVKKGWLTDENGSRTYDIVESRPDFKWVDFFQMFPHPAKLDMDDGLPLIRRRFVDSEDLKSLVENKFFDSKKIEEALKSELSIAHSDNGPSSYQPMKGEKYERIDYWGPWDEAYTADDGRTQTRKAVPYWIIVINRKVCLRAIPNPYDHQMPPFTKTILFPDTKPSWFGVGIGQIGRPTQERINKIVNQRLNNVDLILNRQGIFNGNDPLLNEKRLSTSRPGKWHRVSDVNASMKWLDTPDVTVSSYKEEELAKNDFRESTGATSALMPSDQPSDQHRTAIGIQLMQGAAGMRFRASLRKMETDLIQRTAEFYFSNLNQFMTKDEWIKYTNENGLSEQILITKQDIRAKAKFIPTGISETINKETQIGQLLRFREITANDPTVNRAEMNKRIGELIGFKEVSKLLTPPVLPSNSPTITPDLQMRIKQRIAEGATPEQIKMEMMGPPPGRIEDFDPQAAMMQGGME
jgi:hypothetical protein